jgi:hypothetical protein
LRDIPLADVRTCAEVQIKRHDNVFGIVTPHRTYYMQAPSRSEMENWVHAIGAAKEEFQRLQREESSVASVDNGNNSRPHGQADPPSSTTYASRSIGIAIPGALPPPGSHAPNLSPTEALSSSYSSNPTNPGTSPMGTPANALALGGIERDTSEMSRLSLSSDGGLVAVRHRRRSSDAGSFFMPTSASGGNIGQQRSPSPLASSTDDDEDFAEPSTPGPLSLSPQMGPPPTSPRTEQRSGVPEADRVILSGYLAKQVCYIFNGFFCYDR